jgi:hypothetical protein
MMDAMVVHPPVNMALTWKIPISQNVKDQFMGMAGGNMNVHADGKGFIEHVPPNPGQPLAMYENWIWSPTVMFMVTGSEPPSAVTPCG